MRDSLAGFFFFGRLSGRPEGEAAGRFPKKKTVFFRSGFLLLAFLGLFFKGAGPALADSSGQGTPNSPNTPTTPFMPMMGMFGGGSNQPFSPIRSGILRYPSQGHKTSSDPASCESFHYNSRPPSSGPMTDTYIPKNDLPESVISPCTIVNVIRRGNVIFFYDPSRLTPEGVQTLHQIVSDDSSPEGFLQQQKLGYGVLLVKAKYTDPLVLLAWRRILPLKFIDRIKINLFLSRYRGQIARKR